LKYITFCFLLIGLFACNNEPKSLPYYKLTGKTVGTTYIIQYQGKNPEEIQFGIDSLLKFINLDVSTYELNSTISNFNKTTRDFSTEEKLHPHFLANLVASQTVYNETDGYFDPTLGPIIQYWGFGTNKNFPQKIDSAKVKRLNQSTGLDNVKIEDLGDIIYFRKLNRNVQLDFSAIAKGYAVDLIADYVEEKGIENYYVEIGGELTINGVNASELPWTIGVSTPDPKAPADDISAQFMPKASVATSGNYRNYYEFQDQKFGHTIDPKSGFPVMTNLLSATVFHESCMMADAYATAFMSMGLSKALHTATKLEGVEYLFIYIDENNILSKQHSSGVFDMIPSSGNDAEE